jgi:hypothetical protein
VKMRVSRRVFLSATAVAPILIGSARLRAPFAVVDLGCVLPESLAGYKTQVGDLRHRDADVLIVPRVEELSADGVRMIEQSLQRGATVLLECGLGNSARQAVYFPYVDYAWPVNVKIREFAPVCIDPVAGDEIIGTLAGKPVALRRKVGSGTLVMIGSALGPVFLTGDADARRWLDRLRTC